MAQTIEGFVGKSLDEARISPLHVKIVGLIAAGYFFDVIDFTIFGSLNPYMTKSFATPAEFAFIGSAAIFGMAIGTAVQGQPSGWFGRPCIYQLTLLSLGTTHSSPDHVWRGVWLLIGVGALIVWVFRFTLPESPRYLATHGRGDDAIEVLKRLGIPAPTEPLSTDVASDTKSDPFAVVFKMFPMRVIAGMVCFTAFFGFAIGLGAWLPNIMYDKGFTITKSLQYVLAMNFAVPCASIFMMYALDNIGRKITSVCAFIAAGVMALVFANASSRSEEHT